MDIDKQFITETLQLAQRGRGHVSPNPLVGCVIVKNGKVIARGYHKKFGGPHAESEALKKVKDARGATMYVNLEPCAHYGKTPPCVNEIVKRGIARVVIGMRDVNPLVSGKGISFLKKHGVKVVCPVLEPECRMLNLSFIHWIKSKRPLVVMKIAQTLDGKVAGGKVGGWITGIESRTEAHRLRGQHDAILVGIGTVLKDNPHLNVRHVKGVNPRRIILDTSLKVPLTAHVVNDEDCSRTIIFTGPPSNNNKFKTLIRRGVTVMSVPLIGDGHARPLHLSLPHVLNELGKLGITSILVEGGPHIWTSFLQANLAQRMITFIAPKILGAGRDAMMGEDVRRGLLNVSWRQTGDDMCLEGWLVDPNSI